MPEMTSETLKTAVTIIRNWRIARLNRETLDTMASYLLDLAFAWEADQNHIEELAEVGMNLDLENADLRKRIDRLISGLKQFGDHPRHCRTWQVGLMNAKKGDCTCGLWELIGFDPDVAPIGKEKRDG